MIFDKLENASFYYGLNERIKTAFENLKKTDVINIENGKYEIDGDNLFVIIQDYNSKEPELGKWEAHRKYIDIQCILKGQECLGYLNIDNFTPDTAYDEEKDIIFGLGNGDFITANEGFFIIFYPQDAHMPGICINKPEYVKKAVFKIKV